MTKWHFKIRCFVFFASVMPLFAILAMPTASNPHSSLSLQVNQSVKGLSKTSRWDLTRISAIDQDNVWLVGNILAPQESVLSKGTGLILASTDRGQSWAVRRLDPGKYFSGVHFVDRMNGWVADASGEILRTTDSGYTWTTQSVPSKAFWCDLKFADFRRGWVLGGDGEVLRTVDGGQQWWSSKFVTKGHLGFLDFADANYGWVVGTKGGAYETTDSGARWHLRGNDLAALVAAITGQELNFRWLGLSIPKLVLLPPTFLDSRWSSRQLTADGLGRLT